MVTFFACNVLVDMIMIITVVTVLKSHPSAIVMWSFDSAVSYQGANSLEKYMLA